MRRTLLAVAAASLALTACGSTVQVTSEVAARSGAGTDTLVADGQAGGLAPGTGATGTDGVAAGDAPLPAGDGVGTSPGSPAGSAAGVASAPRSGTSGGTIGGNSGSASGRTSGTSGTAAGSTSGSTTGSAGSAAPAARAVPTGKATGSPVEVGFVLFPDVNRAAAAFGGTADVGDQKGEVEDAVAWVNAHGGLGGHVMKPVYFDVELTSTQPYAVTYQQICASFTEDHDVVATVLLGNAEEGLPACLAKGGSLLLAHGHYLHSGADYSRLANLVTPEEVDSDLAARELVDLVLSRGLAKRGETVGLMVMDYAAPLRARDRIVVPRLKAAGIDVVSYTVGYPQSTPDVANSASAVQSAQLAMAARGVKTVTFLCPGCAPFFLDDAEQQAYYPRYVFTSYDTLSGFQGDGSGRSLKGALAVGWEPLRDTLPYRDRGKVLAGNATFTRCSEIQKRHVRGDASLFAAVSFCGSVLNLKAAADAVPDGRITLGSLARGFESLGSSSPGVGNFATRFAPGRRWGTAAFRTMAYDAGCDCFRYEAGAPTSFG